MQKNTDANFGIEAAQVCERQYTLAASLAFTGEGKEGIKGF
jgi:hypothetical protein